MQLQLANALLYSSDTVQRLQIAFVYMCMYQLVQHIDYMTY